MTENTVGPKKTSASAIEKARAFYANTNAEERAERDAARQAVQRLRYELNLAEARLATAERLNTHALRETAADPDAAPGPRRAAEALLRFPRVDTIARRSRVEAIAHTGMNLGLWAIWSDAVHEAASLLSTLIERGEEDTETYPERTARRSREDDTARREATFARSVEEAKRRLGE